MKLLSIESSGMAASAALTDGDEVKAEFTLNNGLTHSQTLMPMIDAMCRLCGPDGDTPDAIAVSEGPGSFTGLRIGSATAKGMGLVWQIPIVPVPTLEGLAYNAWGRPEVICPMTDARRGHVYAALYRSGEDGMQELMPAADRAIEEIAAALNERGEAVYLLGDGAKNYSDRLKTLLEVPYQTAPEHLLWPRAASVARAARKRYEEGRTVSAADHTPNYMKVTQAERTRARQAGEAVHD